MKFTNEAKVGTLIAGTTLLAFLFAWAVGIQNPFYQSLSFYVTYQFAGGIEVGSPVRVSGIKVGKVEQIEFFVPTNDKEIISLGEPGSAHHPNIKADITSGTKTGVRADSTTRHKAIAPLRLKISVQKEAAVGVRQDSRFYINLAGIIGERYIEITPGHFDTPQIRKGDVVAGIDPPRIDQLISQSFDLAGKIKEVIDENRGDITKSVELMLKLSGSLNKTLSWVDKSAIFKTDLSKLVDNLIAITSSVKKVTDKAQSPEGEKTLKLLHDLLWRLEPLDEKAIQKFFQKEGVKVKLF